MIGDEGVDLVRDVLETVDHLFEVIIKIGLDDEIHRARMQRACHLLLTSTIPVAKVAIRCGFSSPQRFHAVFSRDFGISASEYRDQHRVV